MTNSTLLDIELSGGMLLIELTAQVNTICDQAEGKRHAVIVLRFTNNMTQTNQWPGEVSVQDVNRWERTVRRLERLNVITIAAVSGKQGGPTVDLLLATDYRITTTDCMMNLSVNDSQIWPSMMLHRLVNQVGVAHSRHIVMGNHEISARYALNIAMINEITDSLDQCIMEAVQKLRPMANAEFSLRRQLILEASTTAFEEALGGHLAACDRELNRIKNRNSNELIEENNVSGDSSAR